MMRLLAALPIGQATPRIPSQGGVSTGSARTGLWVLLLTMAMTTSAAMAAPDAAALMEKSRQSTLLEGSEMQASFELIAPSGSTRVRKVMSRTRLQPNGRDTSRITRFTAPADARGIASLLVENSGRGDDLWTYLPSLKKVQRLVADDKKDSFMGTVLSYGDVLGHRPEEWQHRLLGEGQSEGRACWRVESLPGSAAVAKASGYSRRESCVDGQTFALLEARAWDAAGQPLKRIVNLDVRPVAGQAGAYQAYRVEAADLQSGQRTRIVVEQLRWLADPLADDFHPAALGDE